MPWYIPILTAIIGAGAGWWIRAHFDRKASRESLRREIFREYMAMTEKGAFGPYALQRCGALRLTKEEFRNLLDDIAKTGKPVTEEGDGHDFIDGLGLFEALHLVSSRKREALSDMDILESVTQAIADIDLLLQEEARVRRLPQQ